MNTLVISNLGLGDQYFESDTGTWNVTQALRDCLAGKYPRYPLNVAEAVEANAKVEVDEAKIAAMVADFDRLRESPPPVLVMQDGMVWLIDGHHRIRALHQLGVPTFLGFVIPEKAAKKYRVTWNGEGVAPWRRS